jgi:hypothetical protein
VNQDDQEKKQSPLRWSLAGEGEAPITLPTIDPLSKKRDYPKVLRLPLVKENGASASCVCYSWQFGAAVWIDAFLPGLRQWAQRHSIELKVDQQPAIKEGLRESPYRQWIQHFLQGGFDWMMHMDADVMVHPRAPHPLHKPREHGFWAHGQAYPEARAQIWRNWVKKMYQQSVPDDFVYCNDGVWLLDRETAALLLPFTEGYVPPNVPHEYYFNWWRYQLSQQQPESVKLLEAKWNRLPVASQKMQPAWFYHCAGKDKGKVLKELQMSGFLPVPRPQMTFKPWSEKAELPCLISLPYRADGDIWKGLLLKYALRSLEQYGPADWPLIVWGTECPEWLDESVFRYEDMLQRTLLRTYALAEKVLYMNDDIFLLRPCSEADFAEVLHLGGNLIENIPQMMHSDNKWAVGRGVIASRLHHELGVDHLPDYSTHTPYLFHRKSARKAFEFFGIWYKFPQEVAFNGLLGIEGKLCTEDADMKTLDDPLMRWFNVPDEELDNQELRAWMERKFPKPSRWEKSSV